MTGNPNIAKKRVDEALELLRIGLTPYVSQRMERAFGGEWRSRLRGARYGEGAATLDNSALLSAILNNWHEAFSADTKLKRNLVHGALDARNQMAHFAGTLEQKEALRHLDAIHEVLRAISAAPQEEIVLKLYTEQLTDLRPPRHVESEPGISVRPAGAPSPPASAHSPVVTPGERAAVAPPQTQADQIRQFVYERYVVPARRAGLAEITIRAGDVHQEMGLINAIPAVCSAIGSRRFAQLANVALAERTGPTNGSNVYFRFALGTRPPPPHQTSATPPLIETAPTPKSDALNLDDALVLISCVKSKLGYRAPARKLYTSAWFRGVRDLVEKRGAPWFLLSSRYGLVAPDEQIDPYEYTLDSLGVPERRAWAHKVLEKLLPATAGFRRVVIFAGLRYREFLIRPLQQRGVLIEIPMQNLRRGEQLAWLARQH